MSVNDTFRKLKKTLSRQPFQTSSVVFLKSVIAFFFLTHLIERRHILISTCKKDASKLVGSLLNHFYL